MMSTVKLPILKKGDYTLWSMRMEQYLTNTDYALWEVILNGDGAITMTTGDDGVQTEVPPKTAQGLLQRQRERKARSILLLAIPDEYQLNLVEVHGADVSYEDANQKFLRALPSSWSNIALIMRNKASIDELDIDDLYNNLKVFEADIKGSSGQASSSYTDDLMFLFFASQSSSPQLNDDDLEKINHDDLEEMDLKWQVAMLSMKVLIKPRLNAITVIEEDISQGNVDQEVNPTGIEMLGTGTEKTPEGMYLKRLLMHCSSGSDEQRQRLSKANLEIIAYQLEFEVKEKGNAVIRLQRQLDEILKEKVDLKTKLEQFETSSKNLNKLINSQLSTKDKTSLGYRDQLSDTDSSDSEVLNSVFDSRSSDGDDNQANDRFKKDNGYHAVPPPLTGNYMPPLAGLSFAGLDDSVYRPSANKSNASEFNSEASTSQTSNINKEVPKGNSVRSNEVIIIDWVSDDEDIFQSNEVHVTNKPSFKRIEFTKAKNESAKPKQAQKPRKIFQNPKRMANKSVLKNVGKGTGQREVRLFWKNAQRINHQNKFVPSIVLTRSGRVPVNTAKKSSPRAAVSTSPTRLVNTTIPNRTLNVMILNKKVNTVRVNGVNTDGQAVSVVKGNGDTTFKTSAGNKDFLTDYQEYDGGFVAFGGSTRGGRISGKGKIRTNNLDFEDVYFVKELKFNLFSVSQMCDKKNNVLFTESNVYFGTP
ncbi:hypothetical protein Tco_0785466 [Tanacetum coccineum]